MATCRVCLCPGDVDRHDDRDDDAIGGAHDSHLCARRQTGGNRRSTVRGKRLVCFWLFYRLDRVLVRGNLDAMGAGTRRVTYADDGKCQQRARSNRADRGGALPVDAAEGDVPFILPGAAIVHYASWWISR